MFLVPESILFRYIASANIPLGSLVTQTALRACPRWAATALWAVCPPYPRERLQARPSAHKTDPPVHLYRMRARPQIPPSAPWGAGPSPPDAVAWVETTAEVSAVLRLCSEHRCPGADGDEAGVDSKRSLRLNVSSGSVPTTPKSFHK